MKKLLWYFLLCSSALIATSLHVPTNDDIYLFLDNIATRKIILNFNNDTKPLSRDEIAKKLNEIYKQRESLNDIEKEILMDYMSDYRKELYPNTKHANIKNEDSLYFALSNINNLTSSLNKLFTFGKTNEEDQHLFIYETSNIYLFLDWTEMFRLETENKNIRNIQHDGFRFSGQLGQNFCFYMDAYRFREQINNDFSFSSEENKYPFYHQVSIGDWLSFDKTDAYLQYKSIAGSFILGKEQLYWGNSPNSLILSDKPASFAYLGWQKNFYKSKYTFIHGSLLPKDFERDSITFRKTFKQKYFVGHRLEIFPYDFWKFAFSEMVIYGERNPELVYLIPVAFLRPAEHNLNDRDNVALAFESEFFISPGIKLYGTFFMDEMKKSELFKKWWANKHGYQAGIHFAPSWQFLFTDFRLEFTAVRPWTYTHKFNVNTYTHSGVGLGFHPGPNSMMWYLENNYWLTPKHQIQVAYTLLKHGSDDNPDDKYVYGSDPNQNYENRDPKFDHDTKWLMGKILTYQDLNLTWTYKVLNELTLKTRYNLHSENANMKNIDHRIFLELKMDY